ncbi:MAG: hypothetical protein ABW170_19485 [Candidatus Thiodiazotropha sp. L084R]
MYYVDGLNKRRWTFEDIPIATPIDMVLLKLIAGIGQAHFQVIENQELH